MKTFEIYWKDLTNKAKKELLEDGFLVDINEVDGAFSIATIYRDYSDFEEDELKELKEENKKLLEDLNEIE